MDFSDSWHNVTTLVSMTFFFIAYSIVYRVLRRNIAEPPEYICRLLTFAHGLFASICCLHYICAPAIDLYQGIYKLRLNAVMIRKRIVRFRVWLLLSYLIFYIVMCMHRNVTRN